MKTMHNFTSVRLPTDPDDPDYRAAIAAIRRWAGPHVHFGTAEVFAVGKENVMMLHEQVGDRFIALHLTLSEAYGSTLSYTAETPSDTVRSDTGWVEALRLEMRIEPGEVIRIVGASVVETVCSQVAEWTVDLTRQARKLGTAAFLKTNGVDPGLDVIALADAIEAEGDRLAALAGA